MDRKTANNGNAYSDETIRRFLLGTLSATEQAGFEQSLLTDDELSERVRLAELELSDEYAAGRLSASERDLFADRFLLTTDRQRQLKVSEALQQTLSFPSPVQVHESILTRVVSVFDLRRHAWKYAFAALILMLLLGAALLVTKQRLQITQRQASPTPVTPKPTASAVPQSAHHAPNSGAPTHTEQPPALPLHEGLTPSVVLNSNTPLEASPLIRTSGDIVTIELRLDAPLADFYDVKVMTTAGESVFITNGIKRTEAETLEVSVPASAIESGDFRIVLVRADGDSQPNAGTYFFRVK